MPQDPRTRKVAEVRPPAGSKCAGDNCDKKATSTIAVASGDGYKYVPVCEKTLAEYIKTVADPDVATVAIEGMR